MNNSRNETLLELEPGRTALANEVKPKATAGLAVQRFADELLVMHLRSSDENEATFRKDLAPQVAVSYTL